SLLAGAACTATPPVQEPPRSHAEVYADALIPASSPAPRQPPVFEEEAEPPEMVTLDPPRCLGRPYTPRPRSPELSCCYVPPSVFTKVVGEHHDRFAACQSEARSRHIDAEGMVVSRFTIAADGGVPRVCVTASAIADEAFLTCVAESFAALRWPATPPDDPCGDITVSYPLRFGPAPREEPQG
ncbi:MAG: AgmX/PglI C-terminal domain-containing protein, partial [Myxococcales bacterium]|nr:AgmX/PglI C-terminal domain-containing protein [Myxococcales bacterium]